MRASWSCVGFIALIVVLGSPPVTTDATRIVDPQPEALSAFDERPTAPVAGVLGEGRTRPLQIQTSGVPREFYFSRVAYSGYGGYRRGGNSWATDYPKADQIFLSFIDRLLPNLDAFEREFVV